MKSFVLSMCYKLYKLIDCETTKEVKTIYQKVEYKVQTLIVTYQQQVW